MTPDGNLQSVIAPAYGGPDLRALLYFQSYRCGFLRIWVASDYSVPAAPSVGSSVRSYATLQVRHQPVRGQPAVHAGGADRADLAELHRGEAGVRELTHGAGTPAR